MALRFVVVLGLLSAMGISSSLAAARDIKISIPRRSHLTPVQRLNREGVEALRKHQYQKAQGLFYKAYLFDPEDPFTLNNLGYISELQGQIDRAHDFYTSASGHASDAVIDEATARRVTGEPMTAVLTVPDVSLQTTHDNGEAVRLLSQGRASEADILLQQTLARDPGNVFTLNNLGVAKEMEGETQDSLRYYDQAASMKSEATAIVTLNSDWRGKPVAEVAEHNGKALRARLQTENAVTARVAEMNLRGVSAVNRNDLQSAARYFRDAYRLDPNNAFALNNIGYVSEMDGDQETAQYYYDRALRTAGANVSVGLATRHSAEGERLFQVATDNNSKVEYGLTQEREQRRRENVPVLLRRRDNSIVQESSPSPQIAPVH